MTQYGYLFTDFFMNEKDGSTTTLKCHSFIIKDPINGSVIIDTGSPFSTGQLVEGLKEKFNLDPLDFRWVINTHVHPDHIGSNRIFKNATLLLSRKELALSQETADVVFSNGDLLGFVHEKFPGYRDNFGEFESEQMKYFTRQFWNDENNGLNLNHRFFDEEYELPPFLSLIPTPGHSSDHYSVMIRTGSVPILAAGDAVANRLVLRAETIDRSGVPHYDYDQFEKSLNRLKKHSGLISCGHDRVINSVTLEPFKKRIFNSDDISRLFDPTLYTESQSPLVQ